MLFKIFFLLFFFISSVYAEVRPYNFMDTNLYNNLYPYMNNKMRESLNPVPVNNNRRVVSRASVRSATLNQNYNYIPSINQTRRVINRPMSFNQARSSSVRNNNNSNVDNGKNFSFNGKYIPSSKCIADYTQCMNQYCERKNFEYNKCYCSAKLSLIESEYKDKITSLVDKIVSLRNGNINQNNQELDNYLKNTFGSNSYEKIDKNLADINQSIQKYWTDKETRLRGQESFNIGNSYCMQHLQGCFYMSENIRDSYRSEIARDCVNYENNLKKIKIMAESIVKKYSK